MEKEGLLSWQLSLVGLKRVGVVNVCVCSGEAVISTADGRPGPWGKRPLVDRRRPTAVSESTHRPSPLQVRESVSISNGARVH